MLCHTMYKIEGTNLRGRHNDTRLSLSMEHADHGTIYALINNLQKMPHPDAKIINHQRGVGAQRWKMIRTIIR